MSLSLLEEYDHSLSRGKIDLNIVATKFYLFQIRKGKISRKPLIERENGRRNQIWIRESIMQGEGISSPHIY